MKKLTSGVPIKCILIFAVPLFIGQLFQLFYSIADTRIVGSILGETSLAAVGSTTTLSDMLLSLLNGLTNGFAIITASCFGAQNQRAMKKSIGGTFILSGIIAAALSILSLLFLPVIMSVLQISSELVPQARAYIWIILAGLIAGTVYNACAATLRAVGDSFTPLIFLILSALLNILLDYSFIKFLHMGVSGAALATVISQIVSAFLCILYIHKKYPEIIPDRNDMIPDKSLLSRMLKTGISMGFMSSLVSLGTLALQTSINTFGTQIIVAHTAARKVTSIFMLPFSILGTTLATYCGQNTGAGEYERVKKGIVQALLCAFSWAVLMMIASRTIAPYLVRAITASCDSTIIDTASLYLRVDSSFYCVPAAISLLRNSMQGIGDSKTPVFSSFLELAGKVLISLFLAPAIGYIGIIAAEPIVWHIMVIPLIINILRNPVIRRKSAA